MPLPPRNFCGMSKRGVDFGIERPGRRLFSDGPIEDLGPADAARGEHAEPQQQTTEAGSLADRFQVSDEMRAIAEKNVEQARQAFEGLLDAAHRFVGTLGGQTDTAGKGAKGLADRAMTFVEQDIATSFEFAQKLMRAHSMQEVLTLQADYIKARMQLLSPKG
jgi:phasin